METIFNYSNYDNKRYPQDCERIQKLLQSKGHYFSLEHIQNFWESYSDSLCASWINLPEDDEELLSILGVSSR